MSMNPTDNVCAYNPGAFNGYAACGGPDYTSGYYDVNGAYVYPTGPDAAAVVNALTASMNLQATSPTPVWVWLAVAVGAWYFMRGRGTRHLALKGAVA